jgi:hypothetical protein
MRDPMENLADQLCGLRETRRVRPTDIEVVGTADVEA